MLIIKIKENDAKTKYQIWAENTVNGYNTLLFESKNWDKTKAEAIYMCELFNAPEVREGLN